MTPLNQQFSPEVIDLGDPNAMCHAPLLDNYQQELKLHGMTGGLVSNSTIIICGGGTGPATDICYPLGEVTSQGPLTMGIPRK